MASQISTYPVPVVRLIVTDPQGRVLLLRRALASRGGGTWCLPGGKIDYGDTIETAIARELEEETALHCRSSRFLFLQDGLPLEPAGMHCVNLYFECHVTGEVAINDESSEFAWVGADAMPGYDVAFGGAEAIERYWAENGPGPRAGGTGLLSAAVLRQLLELGQYRRFDAGDVLLSEGSPGGNAYVLISGLCGVSIHGEVVAQIQPVEIFGVTATLTDAPRTATITALEPSDTIEITRAKLEHMLRARPEVMAALFHKLLKRTSDASRWEALTRADLHRLQHAQGHLLKPQAMLQDAGAFVVAVHYEACAYASGDYYDAIRMTPTRTLFVVGDAIGHGPKAAMIMAIARSQIHELSKQHTHVSEMLRALDVHFRELGTLAESSGYLMTMAAVIADSETHTVECCVAGHPAPFLRRNGEVSDLATEVGPCLGMSIAAGEFLATEIALREGDEVLLYTDGAFEVSNDRDPDQELLGREGLRNLFRRIAADVPTRQIPGSIAATIAALRGSGPAADDITLLLVNVL